MIDKYYEVNGFLWHFPSIYWFLQEKVCNLFSSGYLQYQDGGDLFKITRKLKFKC